MIFELVQDFSAAISGMPKDHSRHRILNLLEEAIRRDVHFIDLHPTTLFQCMWNTCWWYDCPAADKHFESSVSGSSNAGSPGDIADTNLSTILEHWRRDRKVCRKWLRSARPPRVSLHDPQNVIMPCDRPVRSLDYSPDGTRIATAQGKEVFIWNTATGELQLRFGHTSIQDGVIQQVGFSSHQYLLSLTAKRIQLWDTVSGSPLQELTGDFYKCFAIAFDRQSIACAVLGKLILLEPETLHVRNEYKREENADCLAFSLDGNRLSLGVNGKVKVIDLATQQTQVLHEQDYGYIQKICWSPCGRYLASGGWDRTIRIWSAESLSPIRVITGHEDYINDIAFSPDGNVIASGSGIADGDYDYTVRTWSVESGTQIACHYGHKKQVESIAYSPDGQHVASGSEDKTVRIWNVSDAISPSRRLIGANQADIWDLRWVAENRVYSHTLRVNLEKPTTRIWNSDTGAVEFQFEGNLYDVSHALDAGRFAAKLKTQHPEVTVWDLHTNRKIATLAGEESYAKIALSGDGKLLAVGMNGDDDAEAIIRIWEVDSNSLFKEIASDEKSIEVLEFSPNGEWLAAGVSRNASKFWNLMDGRSFVGTTPNDPLTCIHFHQDSQRVVICSEKESVFCDLSKMSFLKKLPRYVVDAATSLDCRFLGLRFIEGQSHQAGTFDVSTGKMLTKRMLYADAADFACSAEGRDKCRLVTTRRYSRNVTLPGETRLEKADETLIVAYGENFNFLRRCPTADAWAVATADYITILHLEK